MVEVVEVVRTEELDSMIIVGISPYSITLTLLVLLQGQPKGRQSVQA